MKRPGLHIKCFYSSGFMLIFLLVNSGFISAQDFQTDLKGIFESMREREQYAYLIHETAHIDDSLALNNEIQYTVQADRRMLIESNNKMIAEDQVLCMIDGNNKTILLTDNKTAFPFSIDNFLEAFELSNDYEVLRQERGAYTRYEIASTDNPQSQTFVTVDRINQDLISLQTIVIVDDQLITRLIAFSRIEKQQDIPAISTIVRYDSDDFVLTEEYREYELYNNLTEVTRLEAK